MEFEPGSIFTRARNLCLSQAEVMEKLSHGSPAFFVQKGGQFAALWDNHHNDGNQAALLAQPAGVQEALISMDPDIFYRPPYFGPSGWIGVRLDRVNDWDFIEDLVGKAYQFVEAKKRRIRSS